MSVTLYRQIVTDPRHGDPASSPPTVLPGLTDAQITSLLERAVAVHSPQFWGRAFPEAMVLYAAHCAERSPGLIASDGQGTASATGPLTSQKDDLLASTYGLPAGHTTGHLGDADLMMTSYGLRYLQLRGTRCRSAPFTAV